MGEILAAVVSGSISVADFLQSRRSGPKGRGKGRSEAKWSPPGGNPFRRNGAGQWGKRFFLLVANTLILNTFLIILGSFCAEDYA